MIRKSDLLNSILADCAITKQLFTKIPDDGWDYRPSPEQRSTLELGQYICRVGQGCVRAGLDESFDWFGENNERFNALTAADLPAAMDEQMNAIREMFDEMSDEDFDSRKVDMADMGTHTLQGWLLETTLKFLTAYRLQLFLYAKAAGRKDLDTWDAWMDDGTKTRPKPVEA